MKKSLVGVCAIVFMLLFAQDAAHGQKRLRQTDAAQLRELRKEVEALKDGQQAMRAELEELKKLLREIIDAAVAQRDPKVGVDDDPSLGEPTAKVVLIDFSDYQ